MMRLLAAVFFFQGLTSVCAMGEEREFPYKAYVTSDDVYVRSGPGENYYPTDKLKAGQAVEVYRHDPGGWYAIRPPEGSFAWVSGKYLKPGENGLAEVTEDHVGARVGSRFSDVRDVIQVRLCRGEVVEILDTKQFQGGSEERTWYKIAPPSGEFRWVFGKYVDPDYSPDGVRKVSPAENRPEQATAGAGNPAMASDAVVGNGPPVTARTPPEADYERTEADLSMRKPSTPRQMTSEQFRATLEELEIELSAMVAEEPTVWTFDELRVRTDGLVNQAETALERGRARLLRNKIARFEELKHRQDTVSVLREKTERGNRQLAELGSPSRDTGAGGALDDRFDGTGRLTEVPARKLGSPRFALVDATGNVRCYVSPSPGVNLRAYVGRQVGITGSRGYMPEQRATHVMARHISALDDTRLR